MGDRVKLGDRPPDFCLPDQNGKEVCLRYFRGRWLVLYFYPRDGTGGCTMEAVDFSKNMGEFEEMDCAILGVSPDSVKSHAIFASSHNLKITLLSDQEHEVLEMYGVWQAKKVFGREDYGVVRTTLLIAPSGRIEYIWSNVKVKEHVEEVKEKLSELV